MQAVTGLEPRTLTLPLLISNNIQQDIIPVPSKKNVAEVFDVWLSRITISSGEDIFQKCVVQGFIELEAKRRVNRKHAIFCSNSSAFITTSNKCSVAFYFIRLVLLLRQHQAADPKRISRWDADCRTKLFILFKCTAVTDDDGDG